MALHTGLELERYLNGLTYDEDRRGPKRMYRHEYASMDKCVDDYERLTREGYTRFQERFPSFLKFAREGWTAHQEEAMEVCDAAVRMVECEVPEFTAHHDFSGSDVDMGAYLSGEPQNMVDYPLQRVSNIGNVITMCADVQTYAAVSNESVIRRGLTVAGLAMALNRMGHQTDLWVSDEYHTRRRPNEKVMVRTHVKGPNDFIDPARILFAFAHPGVQRTLGFTISTSEPGHDGNFGAALAGSYLGDVTATTRDLPENTIYMPPLYRNSDAPNADVEIRRYMTQLGLIEGEDEE